jgi:hypothetical protein
VGAKARDGKGNADGAGVGDGRTGRSGSSGIWGVIDATAKPKVRPRSNNVSPESNLKKRVVQRLARAVWRRMTA